MRIIRKYLPIIVIIIILFSIALILDNAGVIKKISFQNRKMDQVEFNASTTTTIFKLQRELTDYEKKLLNALGQYKNYYLGESFLLEREQVYQYEQKVFFNINEADWDDPLKYPVILKFPWGFEEPEIYQSYEKDEVSLRSFYFLSQFKDKMILKMLSKPESSVFLVAGGKGAEQRFSISLDPEQFYRLFYYDRKMNQIDTGYGANFFFLKRPWQSREWKFYMKIENQEIELNTLKVSYPNFLIYTEKTDNVFHDIGEKKLKKNQIYSLSVELEPANNQCVVIYYTKDGYIFFPVVALRPSEDRTYEDFRIEFNEKALSGGYGIQILTPVKDKIVDNQTTELETSTIGIHFNLE